MILICALWRNYLRWRNWGRYLSQMVDGIVLPELAAATVPIMGELIDEGETMRTILVANPKGGCGKTTLATNLAAYLAGQNQRVAMWDLDRQKSSLDWLALRPAELPSIASLDAERDESIQIFPKTMIGLYWIPQRACTARILPTH